MSKKETNKQYDFGNLKFDDSFLKSPEYTKLQKFLEDHYLKTLSIPPVIKDWADNNMPVTNENVGKPSMLDEAIKNLKHVSGQKIDYNNYAYSIYIKDYKQLQQNIKTVLEALHKYSTAKIYGKTIDEWLKDFSLPPNAHNININSNAGYGAYGGIYMVKTDLPLQAGEIVYQNNQPIGVALGPPNQEGLVSIQLAGDSVYYFNKPINKKPEETKYETYCKISNVWGDPKLYNWNKIDAQFVGPQYKWQPLSPNTPLGDEFSWSDRNDWEQLIIDCGVAIGSEIGKYISPYQTRRWNEDVASWIYIRRKDLFIINWTELKRHYRPEECGAALDDCWKDWEEHRINCEWLNSYGEKCGVMVGEQITPYATKLIGPYSYVLMDGSDWVFLRQKASIEKITTKDTTEDLLMAFNTDMEISL